jgi:hypothetical protein
MKVYNYGLRRDRPEFLMFEVFFYEIMLRKEVQKRGD